MLVSHVYFPYLHPLENESTFARLIWTNDYRYSGSRGMRAMQEEKALGYRLSLDRNHVDSLAKLKAAQRTRKRIDSITFRFRFAHSVAWCALPPRIKAIMLFRSTIAFA